MSTKFKISTPRTTDKKGKHNHTNSKSIKRVLKKTLSDDRLKLKHKSPMIRSQDETDKSNTVIHSNTPMGKSLSSRSLPAQLDRDGEIKLYRSRAGAFLIPWMKLNRSKVSHRASIQTGTKAYAQHNGRWYEVMIVIVTEGHQKILHYGVVYPFSSHIYQLTRDRIITKEEYEREKKLKENEPGKENTLSDEEDEEINYCSSCDDNPLATSDQYIVETNDTTKKDNITDSYHSIRTEIDTKQASIKETSNEKLHVNESILKGQVEIKNQISKPRIRSELNSENLTQLPEDIDLTNDRDRSVTPLDTPLTQQKALQNLHKQLELIWDKQEKILCQLQKASKIQQFLVKEQFQLFQQQLELQQQFQSLQNPHISHN